MIKDTDTWEINDGWIPLVGRTLEEIESLTDKYTIAQVKEKFGGLRIYLSQSDPDDAPSTEVAEQVRDIISRAEKEASTTCELCGSTDAETYADGYWLKTRCQADR